MSDLVVVSNRGPASFALAADGSLEVRHGAGGLAPSLVRALGGTGSLWVAAALSEADRRGARRPEHATLPSGTALRLVEVPEALGDAAWRVIANGTLWYLAHGLFDLVHRPVLDRRWHEAWEGYRAFNRLFADEVARHANEGATVIVNDYHLFLVGGFLRAERPDLRTVHFTHTPFPDPRELDVLPRAVGDEVLAAMASYGACAFHTARWAESFRSCCVARSVTPPALAVVPLGTDADALGAFAASAPVTAAGARLAEEVAGRSLVLRSDRLELSKNLVRGFLAFEELLDTVPQWRGRVLFLARTYPSRTDLPEYLAYRATVESTVARINERFADRDGGPILLEVADDYPASVAALAASDVLLVNPVRDGMNLVAREGPVVNGVDGVLALSREAGAFAELGAAALEVEPFDVSGTAQALHTGLSMPPDERRRRAEALRALAPGLAPARWLERVIAAARPAARA